MSTIVMNPRRLAQHLQKVASDYRIGAQSLSLAAKNNARSAMRMRELETFAKECERFAEALESPRLRAIGFEDDNVGLELS